MKDGFATNNLSAAFPRELAKSHEFYDPDARLLRKPKPTSSEDIEDTSTVHSLRPSLSYAVALLDSREPRYRDRAVGIVDRVLRHQEDDRDSPYCGCWPYYAEQSLSELSHIDLNWALFLGRELIHLLDEHADRLSDSLAERVEAALRRAAFCSKDRDVNPTYTNIAAMNAYVLIAAGTLLGDDELLDHGRGKLREFVGYTRYHDGFTEYNSPTYTVIIVGEIGRMMARFDDESDLALANALNDYAWRSLATHYHPSTAKLAGPHSRAYDDEFHDDVEGTWLRSIVYAGTGGEYGVGDEEELEFPENDPPLDLNWHRPVLDCPEKYYDGFEACGPEFVRDRFYDGADDDRPANELTPHEAPGPVEARSYRTSTYSIGSFTKSHLWNQRRPLIGYWGDPADPGYVRLRCLRDGADFLPAMLAASQYENHVLGAVNFVTDYDGLASDPGTLGSIEVEELSVRFEVGTAFSRSIEGIEVCRANDDGFSIETGDVTVDVALLHCEFGPGDPAVNAHEGSDSPLVRKSVWIDVTLYDGEPTVAEFDSVTSAAVLFRMTVQSSDDEAGSAAYSCGRLEDGRLRASMSDPQLPGQLTVPDRPRPYGEYFSRTTIDENLNNLYVVSDSRR